MIVVQTCVLGAAMVVALFYFGWGVTRLILPPQFNQWRALCTPMVGIALIVVWDYIALFLNFNLTAATIVLAAVVTIVNAVALWIMRKRAAFFARFSQVPRAHIWLTGLATLVFFAGVAPLWRYGYATIIGENWDYEFYLPLADLLRNVTTRALDQVPANPLLETILSRHLYPLPMGFAYLQSSLDVLTGAAAIDSYAVLLAVLHALGIVAAFVFFRATFKMSSRVALAAAALIGLNGLLLWLTYWGFGLHLTALALVPLAIAFGADLLGLKGGEPAGIAEDGAQSRTRFFQADARVVAGGVVSRRAERDFSPCADCRAAAAGRHRRVRAVHEATAKEDGCDGHRAAGADCGAVVPDAVSYRRFSPRVLWTDAVSYRAARICAADGRVRLVALYG